MKRLKPWILCMALFAMAIPARAEEAPAPTRPWKEKAEASFVTTNGNSKGTTTSVKNLYTYNWSKLTGLELAAGGLGARNSDGVTAENYNASEKVTWKLVGKNYLFERFGWDKDRFAGIGNRYDGSVGVGRLLLDLPKDKLNGELGGGYINEERKEAPRNDYPAGRAVAKYVRTVTATSNFSQDVEYIHNFNDAKGYRLNTVSAITAAISTMLSLKASFTWKRNGFPPPNTVKDDTITSMALVVSY